MPIQIDKKLELLADSLVPQAFQLESPQFYEFIKAFLVNIQDVQDSINGNFLDTIDVTKIKNEEINRIYVQTYLSMLNLEDEENISGVVELIQVSKELSMLKGTQLLYTLLVRLLVYVLPEIGSQYNTLLQQYNEATGEEKALLEEQLNQLRINNFDRGYIEYGEFFDGGGNLVPFQYSIVTDFESEVFFKYIYPFAHPAGWLITFTNLFKYFVVENISLGCTFRAFDTFVFLAPLMDGSSTMGNTGKEYPTSAYARADMGPDTEYANILDKLTTDTNLVVEGGRVYYEWDNMSDPLNIVGNTTTEGELQYQILTPTDENPIVQGGSYTNTIGVSKGNGGFMISDNQNISYKVIIDDKNETI